MMQSHDERGVPDIERVRRNVHLALLVALASIAHTIEAAIPTPVPWLRFGFANILTVAAISLFDFWAGITVSVLRTIVGSLIIGTFLSPAFFIGLSGGIVSALIMGLSYRFFGRFFSLVGISVLGAYASSLAQVAVVYLFFIRHSEILVLLPVILGIGLLTGIISGMGSEALVGHLKTLPSFKKAS